MPGEDASTDRGLERFAGHTPQACTVRTAARRAARTDFPVLLTGETGTGKSVLARMIHDAGPRARAPFITVYCPCLERGLVESELFGCRRGAFTGALADRGGKVQAAEGGTLFLDEIGDLPLEIQPKLLRLLQEARFERLGDPTEHRANVRTVAATNRDLADQVRRGRFRADLYERLNFLPIAVPPLRSRRDDIPELLDIALEQYGLSGIVALTEDSLAVLVSTDLRWPGNFRDLQHLAARLAATSQTGRITPETLREALHLPLDSDPTRDPSSDATLPQRMAAFEKRVLREALGRWPGMRRDRLAAKLGISRAALFEKLRRHKLR